jgi:hypothetical protein
MYNTAWFSQPQRRRVHLFPTLHLVFPSCPVPATLSPDGGTPSSLGFGSCLLSFALSGFWVGVSRCCFFLRVRIPAVLRKYYG